MQLAILHYHLNPGGVARVIHNHLLAMAAADEPRMPERVLLIQGRRATNWPHEQVCSQLPFPTELITVDGLDYDGDDAIANDALGDAIESALIDSGCRPDDTLLHWHNHSLGKNVSAPLAVRRLAECGYRTLLQIHDFAEDFRPANYLKLHNALATEGGTKLADVLYPRSKHIHYAVLNRRDYNVLVETGIDQSRLHLLQNPVAGFGEMPERASSRERIGNLIDIPTGARLLCYPVRGIRRKNLGEMLLWSTVLEDTWFFVTLAPENPVERASFERWRGLAEELKLRCRFGKPASADVSFAEILAGSDALVTTSVAEGFGMAFLECWLAERPLFGRDLPSITRDACDAGLNLDVLYDELRVPCDWIDRRQFIEQMSAVVWETYGCFGIGMPPQASLEEELAEMLDHSTIDFARLPSKLQADVIRRAAANPRVREKLLQLNPKLLPTEESDQRIAANAAVVADRYSLSALGNRLAAVYTQVLDSDCNSDITGPAHGGAVLDAFLRIDRLHAVRVEP